MSGLDRFLETLFKWEVIEEYLPAIGSGVIVTFELALLYAADMARSVSYNASPIVMAAVIYLAILWPAIRLMSRFERRIGAV